MANSALLREPLIHVSGAAGLDEAGRGPLAGPVAAAAVVLPERFDLAGIDDSKKLSPAQREELADRIRAETKWAVAWVEVETIDRINILWAAMLAMEQALQSLGEAPAEVFVDGDRVPRSLTGRALSVVGGDGKYACIAAASILAKTARDEHMRRLAAEYPEYGFDRHFGYGTPEHLAALQAHGPCPIHRRSFAPVSSSQLNLFEPNEA
ncbi:MAG TPA: ribonuclease HII [Fimbriimonadaceae bacterium]|nr:ribonuclease HII [Fimbriimonadaceae bacterium]